VFTVVAVTAILAAAAGYWAARRRNASEAGAPLKKEGAAKRGAPQKAALNANDAKKKTSPFEGMPLALGDVVVAEAAREERWLAGALVAREGDRTVAALFVSPEGAVTRAVAVFGAPRRDIYWLEPASVTSPAEPPATLEIGESMLSRRSRLPVSVERLGQGAPHVGDAVLWAVYEGGGREVAVLITGGGSVHAWRGSRLDEGEYDRFGSAGASDD
jgi:hypothetical protein